MILVNNISKNYKVLLGKKNHDVNVLRDVFFEINEGDVIGLVGHNGSGKTTLLKILFNLIKEDSGKILFNDSANSYDQFIKEKASLVNKNERSFFGVYQFQKILFFLIVCLKNQAQKVISKKR